MGEEKDLLLSYSSELRRGTLVLSVLGCLKKEKYGYLLVQELCEGGIEIDPGTLYPLLRRLEKQGLLQSRWDTQEAKPRKYYLRTREGDALFEALLLQWKCLSQDMAMILKEDEA